MAQTVSFTTLLQPFLELFLLLHEISRLGTRLVSVIHTEKIKVFEQSIHQAVVYEAEASLFERLESVPQVNQHLFPSSINLRSIHLNQVLMVLVF